MKEKARQTQGRPDVPFGSLNRVDRISGFTMATVWEGVTSVVNNGDVHIDTTRGQEGGTADDIYHLWLMLIFR